VRWIGPVRLWGWVQGCVDGSSRCRAGLHVAGRVSTPVRKHQVALCALALKGCHPLQPIPSSAASGTGTSSPHGCPRCRPAARLLCNPAALPPCCPACRCSPCAECRIYWQHPLQAPGTTWFWCCCRPPRSRRMPRSALCWRLRAGRRAPAWCARHSARGRQAAGRQFGR